MLYQIDVFDGNGDILVSIVKNTITSPWFCCIGNSSIREIEYIPVLWRYISVWKDLKKLFVPAHQPLTIRIYSYGSFVFGLSDITPEEVLQALAKCIDNPEKYIKEMKE